MYHWLLIIWFPLSHTGTEIPYGTYLDCISMGESGFTEPADWVCIPVKDE